MVQLNLLGAILGIYDIEDKKVKMSQKERDEMMKKFLDKGGKNTEIKG